MYIAVAGNIGSGKTTLTKMLSKHYGWKQYLEPVAENPYIDDYYKDISRWALNMEVFYLKQRFKKEQEKLLYLPLRQKIFFLKGNYI
jgi:deoxyadenosine/deoxycytidine kinase